MRTVHVLTRSRNYCGSSVDRCRTCLMRGLLSGNVTGLGVSLTL